jgi:methionyl-tRNA formyltransferase
VRAVFFGTPEVAATALQTLLTSRHEVAAVVTQPDRPKGRTGTPQPSPAKRLAAARGIPVMQPETPKEKGFVEGLRAFQPGVLAVVAYGHLLPPAVLDVAPAVNAHFSLLPRYRGAAPVQRALLAGEIETGVTTFLLEAAMDAGPVLLQERVAIGPEETAGDLLARLAPVGARLLVESIDRYETGALQPVVQDPSLASAAPKVRPDEAHIDWSRRARAIVNMVRAFNPSPGAWTEWNGKRLKVWRAVEGPPAGTASPGSLLNPPDVYAAGDGSVRLVEVQPEGGKRMTAAAFFRGHTPGALGSPAPS